MKKSFYICATIILVLGLLAGCGSSSENIHEITLLDQQFIEDAESHKGIDNSGEEETENHIVDYANGGCGKNLNWTLSVDGKLNISGTGEMWDFPYKDNVPWDDYDELIISVVIEDGVSSVGRFAFCECQNLKSVVLPKSVNKVLHWAFVGCSSLEEIDLPDEVTELPVQAFSHCTNLKHVTLPQNLQTIEDYAFVDCTSLKEISFPDKLRYIGNQVFDGCVSLESVHIPSSVAIIGNSAFKSCVALKTINIPDGIYNLSDVFQECGDGLEVYFEGDAPGISNYTFWNTTATCYYPTGNRTWTVAKMTDYGGSLTWIAQ